MYRKLQGTHLGGHVDSHDAAILLLKFSVMIGNAGNADGHFGAIFLQNWEVQCTGKLQVAHLRGHVDSHNGEIGLLKFSIMIGNAGSADGQNGQFWSNFTRKLGGACTQKLQGTPLGDIVDTHHAEIAL